MNAEFNATKIVSTHLKERKQKTRSEQGSIVVGHRSIPPSVDALSLPVTLLLV